MINKQLVDFIKQQLQKGITREVISKELLVGDWTLQDIDEGFKSINIINKTSISTPPPTQSSVSIKASIPSPVTTPILDPDSIPFLSKAPIQTSIPTIVSNFHTTSNRPMSSIENHNHTVRNVFLTIMGLFLLAGLMFGYFFRDEIPVIKDLIKNKNSTINEINQNQNTQLQIQDEQGEVQPEIQPEQKPEAITDGTNQEDKLIIKNDDNKVVEMDNGPINCGKDMTCFMDAIKNCSKAYVEETKIMDFFGMVQTTKIISTLDGFDSSKKCLYSTYILDASLDYSTEMIAQAKASGVTEENLDLQLKKSSESVKGTIGMITKCSFTTVYLSELFIKWNKGSFSSSDMDPGNCTISGGTLPLSSTTIYLSSTQKEMLSSGLKFNYINITKDTAKLMITQISTGKTQTVDFIPNKEIIVFDTTITLIVITEENYTLNGEIIKYLEAEIEIKDK